MMNKLGLLPLLLLPAFAHAQAALDVNVNFGAAWDSATGQGIDNSTGASCGAPLSSTCELTPKLDGFFLGFGGDIMFRQHLGVGAEINFQPVHQDYSLLKYRQSFIDVNGIYEPLITKRAIVQLQGGIGTARTGFVVTQTSCIGTAACTTSTSPYGSATHFQVHFGAGVQIALTNHFFVRPQFDLHYVPNFTNQFGSDLVPEATLAVGYHFGER
ncbi:MAG: porin family protein [Acidobacteriota bacterium]|nr:porin family protein [Acidobacteriota bacterium]